MTETFNKGDMVIGTWVGDEYEGEYLKETENVKGHIILRTDGGGWEEDGFENAWYVHTVRHQDTKQ